MRQHLQAHVAAGDAVTFEDCVAAGGCTDGHGVPCGLCGTITKADSVMELGPNSGPRLATMACPMCDTVESLTLVVREISKTLGSGKYAATGIDKPALVFNRIPVMGCTACGRELIGHFDYSDGRAVFDHAVSTWKEQQRGQEG
jgi:hypothetical protein